MFSEKNIVVTIGDHGVIVALYSGHDIKNKIFVEELDAKAQEHLQSLFVKNKSAPIHILLDTADQSYKKKTYPSVRKGDLRQIIKRDLSHDNDKESIKNYTIFDSKKSAIAKDGKRWEVLFVAASNSESISKWLSFILEAPNNTVGIYMLPIETFSTFKLLKKSVSLKSKIHNKRNDIYCIITQNKVSGIRQTVFSDDGIVFTRTFSYKFSDEDAMEKYEHDLYSTFEYLKRLFPDLRISEFDVINILPKDILDNIEKINNIELSLINYTPNKAAIEAGYPKLLAPESRHCDLLISKIFVDKPKILKFTTPKILFFERFFVTLRSSYYLNLVLLMVFCSLALFNIIMHEKSSESIEISEIEKLNALQNLNKLKKISLEGAQEIEGEESVSIERIIDLGKNEELFGTISQNFNKFFDDLKFLKKFGVKLERISYNIPNVTNKSMSPNMPYEVRFGGEITNKSGDIEDLFQEFDSLVAEVKKNSEGKQIRHSELPRNIDFNKKYYSFPVDFTITTK